MPDGCRPAWPRPRLLTLARGVLRCTTSISPVSTAAVRRTIYLVDRTGNGCGKAPPGSRAYHRSCAGFRTDAASFSFYTSLECAQTILVANGVRADAIRPVNATRHDVLAIGRASVDLVVSFASMGFHYSVDAYAQEIRKAALVRTSSIFWPRLGSYVPRTRAFMGRTTIRVWCTLPPWGPVACRAKQG